MTLKVASRCENLVVFSNRLAIAFAFFDTGHASSNIGRYATIGLSLHLSLKPSPNLGKLGFFPLRPPMHADDDGPLSAQIGSVRILPGTDGPRLASGARGDAIKAAVWAVTAARQSAPSPAVW